MHAAVDDDAQQKLLQAREERNKMEAVRSHVEVELKGLQYVCAVVGRAPAGGGAPPLLSEQNLHSVCVKELAKGRRRRLRQDEQVHCDGANVVALVLSRIWRCCVVLVASQNASGAVGQVPFLKGWQHFCNFVAPRGRPESCACWKISRSDRAPTIGTCQPRSSTDPSLARRCSSRLCCCDGGPLLFIIRGEKRALGACDF